MKDGDVIDGRYRVEKLLGQGGMGQVFRGHDNELDKQVAIKVLFPNTPDLVIKRFHTEAKALAALSHPNIMTIQHFGQAKDGQLYLVMDFVKGDSLGTLIEKRGAQTFFDVLPIFEKICRGLRFAHTNNVLHRDIKPSNVMLALERNKDDSVKLVDFGLAKQADKDQELTKTGSAMGSPPYMSPEAVHGKETDERSDIYSLGCTFYEMIAGRPPFVGDTPFHTMMAQINRLPPSLAETCGKTFDEEVEEFIQKCLKKNPADRFQNMDELIEELERIRDSLIAKKHASDGILASGIYASGAFFAEKKRAVDEWYGKNSWKVLVTGSVLFIVAAVTIFMSWSKDRAPDVDITQLPTKDVAPKVQKSLDDGFDGMSVYHTGVSIIDDKTKDPKTNKNRKAYLLYGEMSDDELKKEMEPYMGESIYQLENLTISEKAMSRVLGLGIEKLNLFNMKVTDTLFDEIGKMQRLQFLQIMKCGDLPPGTLERLKSLPHLQTIEVETGTNYPNVGAAISGPKTLMNVVLHHSSLTRNDISTMVEQLPVLVLFKLQDCTLTPDALTDLKKAKNLMGLELTDTKLTGKSIEHIAAAPKLIGLNLHRNDIDDEMLKGLNKCKCLKSLDLAKNDVSESTINALKAAMPSLTVKVDKMKTDDSSTPVQ